MIDHVVIVTNDLNKTTSLFEHAGFTVISGGTFPDQVTNNALVPFEDGSYLELFAPVDFALAE